MLYLIGLGLNYDSISTYGLTILKRCKKVYIEDYTVNFPYSKTMLAQELGKKVIPADRNFIESLAIIDEAAKKDVCLLIYGSPLTATTHITLLDEAKRSRVKTKVIHNASVLDAAAESGLQLYKFGKVTSMPAWIPEKGFTPDSFMDIVKENKSIGAHSLILMDIGLKFREAIKQLKTAAKNHKVKLGKIVVCQTLGTKQQKFLYRHIDEMGEYTIRMPYCLVIPGKLHFVEREFLEHFK